MTLATALVAVALALPSMAHAHDAIGTDTMEQPRDIAISMDDTLRFDPVEVTVGAGEIVRFVLTNTGATTHDFVIGDQEAQEEHGAEMAAGTMHMAGACHESEGDHADEAMGHMDEADEHMDEVEDHMDEAADHAEAELCPGGIPGAVTIEPGETVSVLARFDEPGETLYGCHQPGHWEVGMKGTITVVDAA